MAEVSVPTFGELLMRARQNLSAGEFFKAETIYRQLVEAVPQAADAWHELGIAQFRAGQFQAAVSTLRQAIVLDPANAMYRVTLGAAQRSAGEPRQAAESFERALTLGGPAAEVYNNLGLALKDDGQIEAALAAFDHALALKTDYANGAFNRGNLLADAGRYEEAIDSYRRAIALNPADAGAYCRLGVAYGDLGCADEALAAFEHALAINPKYAEAHRNRAFVWLAQGRYREGWREFEWRLACDDLPMPQFAKPQWDGSPLDGRKLLLYGEQGLGDTLQFMRYVPLVEEHGGQAVLGVPASLIALLTVSGFGRWIVPRGTDAAYDLHCPLLSFPHLFGGEDGRPLWRGPYLKADPARIARWRDPLAAIGGFKVGIAWAGNPGYLHDRYRSVRLEAFAPLARVPGVRLVSLQKGAGDDLRRVAGQIPIVDLGDSFDAEGGAFMDTAAVISHLDLVVGVNSSIAHLSGGLGAPVWMALQRSVDWRWPASSEQTPWYPSMRIFHQQRLGDWSPVFEVMAERLAVLAAGRPPSGGQTAG